MFTRRVLARNEAKSLVAWTSRALHSTTILLITSFREFSILNPQPQLLGRVSVNRLRFLSVDCLIDTRGASVYAIYVNIRVEGTILR